MAKISATSSMGVKLKIFSDYENVSPHISITVEDDVDEALSREERVESAGELYRLCRKYVQDAIEEDIATAKAGKDRKYIGRKKVG